MCTLLQAASSTCTEVPVSKFKPYVLVEIAVRDKVAEVLATNHGRVRQTPLIGMQPPSAFSCRFLQALCLTALPLVHCKCHSTESLCSCFCVRGLKPTSVCPVRMVSCTAEGQCNSGCSYAGGRRCEKSPFFPTQNIVLLLMNICGDVSRRLRHLFGGVAFLCCVH